MLSDFWPHGEAATKFGVFRSDDGHSERAIFLIDREGVVRYVDVHDIEDQPDNEVLFGELAKLEPELAAAAEESAKAAAESAEVPAPSETAATSSSGVVMYCTPWCPDCRRARAWLHEHGVNYVEVDVSTDKSARERAAEHNNGDLHTPTFEIGGEVCVDFRPDRLVELLGL